MIFYRTFLLYACVLVLGLVHAVRVAPAQDVDPRSGSSAVHPQLLAELRAAQGHLTEPIALTYMGTQAVEGELARPGQIVTLASRPTISIRDGVVAWDLRLGPEGATGDALFDRERGVLSKGIAFSRQGDRWHPQTPQDSIAVAHSLGSILPWLVLQDAVDPVPDPTIPGRYQMKTSTGQPVIVQTDPATRRVTEVHWPRAHRRLGDVTDVIRYGPPTSRVGVQVPTTVETLTHEDCGVYRGNWILQPEPGAVDLQALDAAPALIPPPPFSPAVDVEKIAEGLWAFTHAEADCRTLVMETDDGLFAFEAPLSSLTGEQIVASIQGMFPGKPLKAIAFSHHHAHYAGGLRAFVAAGCDVYTTPALEGFVRQVLARPFTRQPDALQRHPRTPVIHTVRVRKAVVDNSSAVNMLDVGGVSQHTDSYLIFFFPRHNLLFQGDLGYVQPQGTLQIMAGRALGLVQAAQAQGWTILQVLQAWPAHDTPPLPWRTLLNAVYGRQPAGKAPETTPPPAAPETTPPPAP